MALSYCLSGFWYCRQYSLIKAEMVGHYVPYGLSVGRGPRAAAVDAARHTAQLVGDTVGNICPAGGDVEIK